MTLRDVFARNLRKARAKRGLSQETLAHDAGVDRTYISTLENSRNSASIDMIERLAKVLRVEPSELLDRRR